MMRQIGRWIPYSLMPAGLILALLYGPDLLLDILTTLIGLGILLRCFDQYEHVLHVGMQKNTVFVEDWVPMAVLIPIAIVLAFKAGMMGYTLIYTVHWIGTIRLMRRLIEWKKLRM